MNAVLPITASDNLLKTALAKAAEATPAETLRAAIAKMTTPLTIAADFDRAMNPNNHPAYKMAFEDYDADKGISANVKYVVARKVGDQMAAVMLEQNVQGDFKSYILKMDAAVFDAHFKQFADVGSKGSLAGWYTYLPTLVADSLEMSHSPEKFCRALEDTLFVTRLSTDEAVSKFAQIAMCSVDSRTRKNVMDKILDGHIVYVDNYPVFLSPEYAEKRLAELKAVPALKGTEDDVKAYEASLAQAAKNNTTLRIMTTNPYSAPKAIAA
ncbi:MAG TPA: hypothetical protein VIN59_05060 [Alphaproteobacteria bacterium]